MVQNPILNGRYQLVEQIGSGGMAVLYKATDLELGRTVAAKVLRPSLVNDAEFLKRFKDEARSAANLSHPNIVTVHDVGSDGPTTQYIVMEFVEGQNLKQLLRSTRVFEVDAALDIIIEVCKGVGYAHRAGLIHCDLKPQNILVTPERRIKVVDFGIARAYSPDQQAVMEDTVWGSPSYFSPEQARGESPTPASDVYSIGVVLFELLTGRLPFEGEDFHALALAHIQTPPPSILSINSALPQELDKITQTTLSKEPSQRYRTADQLGRILLSYSQQGLERTSSFVVNRSQARMKPVRPEEEVRQAPPPPSARPPIQPRGLRPRIQEPAMNIRPEPPGEPTIPSLPPIDTGPAAGRAASPPPAASYASPPPRVRASQSYGENGYEDPGLDIYGIVLGIFAGLLVMGLIPLWMTVYFTLTR